MAVNQPVRFGWSSLFYNPLRVSRAAKEPYIRRAMALAPFAAAGVVLIGSGVLVGYLTGYQALWRPLESDVATHPLSALSFVLLGFSALLARPMRPSNASAALALLAGLIALFRLSAIILERDDLFNGLPIFRGALSQAEAMGITFASAVRVCGMIICLALSLLLIRVRRISTAQIFALMALYPPALSIIGYIYEISNFEVELSLTTLSCAFLCIFAILGRAAYRNPFKNVLIYGPSGRNIRITIIVFLSVYFLLGFIVQKTDFYTVSGDLALDKTIVAAAIVLALTYSAFHLVRPRRWRKLDDARPVQSPLLLDLGGAIDRGEMFLVYQPQVSLSDDRLVGVEVLIRWNHPTRGLVSPADFIPLAESSGLILPLGEWVLEEACRQSAMWTNPDLAKTVISVNASPFQIKTAGFAEKVLRIVRSSGIAPARVVLEITESALVQKDEKGLLVLSQLRENNIKIAIDDFGTGYSSLSYLRDLPSDYLKIDQSFVKDVPGDPRAEAIARAIVAVGKSLGHVIVAEGIETREQAEFLQGIWCDEGQGYLYARPMLGPELEVWAANRGRRMKASLPTIEGPHG